MIKRLWNRKNWGLQFLALLLAFLLWLYVYIIDPGRVTLVRIGS